ncbi:TldD/PmbA family protein [Capillimicrobium parvum]|uniref:Metalloprotease TldD n=1 Tax=Capillimicrobium parvum TaxID=2884022 RepID=A0A9E7BZF7_9ACTN|nr:TldD/PmbA family protein [Capillimicrobium parvum]UGS35266.1 Metalloprotease TldD [Capillimicrobium parvum]
MTAVSVRDLLQDLLGVVPAGCDHAEARVVVRDSEAIGVRNGAVEWLESEASAGVGVRVRSGGAWGFAATAEMTPAAARGALARAIAVAEAQPRPAAGRRAWAAAVTGVTPATGTWASPCAQDPFAVSVDVKLDHLLAAEAAMAGDARIARREASCLSVRTHVTFASTAGALCEQTIVHCGGGLEALAVDGDEAQVRSYPSGHGGSVAAAGWEHLLSLDLAANAPRVAEEAVALLTAPVCPTGPVTLVLGGEQLALQVHESIGHALELDRMLGAEASYAGTSWIAPSDIGSLRFGSEPMHVTADATLPGGLGTFAWDDEGVAARRTTLVDGGILRAALSDRTSAAAIGLAESGGCARADGFARQPIVRMTNVSLEPGGAGSLADLLADTGEGLYLETNRSWSIDDRRLHFQFGTEIAREIRRGELGRLYRNASYAGVSPRFWGSLDAVCSAPEWRLHGLLNCGKGEPGQIMAVSHGTAPARFRGVEVGAGGGGPGPSEARCRTAAR